KHGAGGAPSVVADPIKMHDLREARLGNVRSHIFGDPHRLNFIHVVVREIGKDSAAIRGFPPEELVGELGGVVPIHLLRNEVIETRSLVDLRELPIVAKRIGIPADSHLNSEFLLEVTLADQDLPYQGLSAWHVE